MPGRWWARLIVATLIAVGLTGVPAASVWAAERPTGKATATVVGERQLRISGSNLFDPTAVSKPVKLQVFVHQNGNSEAVHFFADSRGAVQETITTAYSGPVTIHIWAIGQDPGNGSFLFSEPMNLSLPITTLTSGPPAHSLLDAGPTKAAEFVFSADTAASFVCSLDGGALQPCVSPTTYQVAEGSHRFEVRGLHAHGALGEPALHTFVVGGATPPSQPQVPAEPALKVRAKAVKKGSKLRVAISPGSAEVDFRFVVQKQVASKKPGKKTGKKSGKKSGKKWRTVKRSTTRKASDLRVLNLRRGVYRVTVPAQHGAPVMTSRKVRLRS